MKTLDRIQNFFRPTSHDALKQNPQPNPPSDWRWSGWRMTYPEELKEGYSPCQISDFLITGYVIGIHRTTEKYAGSQTHIIFSPELPPRHGRGTFRRTREGGLIAHPSSVWQGQYRRQIHLLDEDQLFFNQLKKHHENKTRIELFGIFYPVTFDDPTAPEKFHFAGWNGDWCCPCGGHLEITVIEQPGRKAFDISALERMHARRAQVVDTMADGTPLWGWVQP